MNNHTINIKINELHNENNNLFFLITCLGTILYSLSEIFNININAVIQNRLHLNMFNYILLLSGLISIFKITIFQKLLFFLIYNIMYLMLE
jgi:hypothetical protein